MALEERNGRVEWRVGGGSLSQGMPTPAPAPSAVPRGRLERPRARPRACTRRAAAGRLHPSRGVGLRFPRFVGLRPDKGVEEASGPDLVERLYRQQARRAVR